MPHRLQHPLHRRLQRKPLRNLHLIRHILLGVGPPPVIIQIPQIHPPIPLLPSSLIIISLLLPIPLHLPRSPRRQPLPQPPQQLMHRLRIPRHPILHHQCRMIPIPQQPRRFIPQHRNLLKHLHVLIARVIHPHIHPLPRLRIIQTSTPMPHPYQTSQTPSLPHPYPSLQSPPPEPQPTPLPQTKPL